MTKFILENKVVYDSVNHSLFYIDQLDTQTSLAIPASLCLLAMLNKKNETVSLDELQFYAWESRGMSVSPNTIYQNISILRKSLIKFGLACDFIKTVPKRGFVVLGDQFSEMENNEKKASIPEATDTQPGIEKQTIRDDSEKKTQTSPNVLFFLSIISVSFILFYASYQFTLRNEIENSPYIYPELTQLNISGKCHLFRNKSLASDLDFIKFISSQAIDCSQNNWVYIINYPPAPQTFVLKCSADVFFKNTRDFFCKSEYYY
ncbi:transcriptional regulator [Cedecea davisae]|uniref:winged helix-turn-helix domain-containing protein n=1 Tax=Cedecea davisae TaxID=158484 RepID=UPI00376EDED2